MRALVIIFLIAAILSPPAAVSARQTCLFFCNPAHGYRHHRHHRRPIYVPLDPAAVSPNACKQINDAVGGLSGTNLERIRRTMTPQQLAIMDKCAAGGAP